MRVPGGAVHDGGSNNWLCNGARAVGDCQDCGLAGAKLASRRANRAQSTYLGHSVGLAAVYDGCGRRAVGGIGGDNLSGVADSVVALGVGSRSTGREGNDNDSGKHLDLVDLLVLAVK